MSGLKIYSQENFTKSQQNNFVFMDFFIFEVFCDIL